MRPHAIENTAPPLILVETVVQVSPQKTAALRYAEADGALQEFLLIAERGIGSAVLQERHDIAPRRWSQANQERVFASMPHFVEPARLESGLHADVSGVGERPVFARDRLALAEHGVAHVHLVSGIVRVGYGVAE